MSGWRCATCGEPVALADARAHYDRCEDANPDRCALCDSPADESGELCDRCQLVAAIASRERSA